MSDRTIWRYVKAGFIHPKRAIGGIGSELRGRKHYLFDETDIRRLNAIYMSRLAYLEKHGLCAKLKTKVLDALNTPPK